MRWASIWPSQQVPVGTGLQVGGADASSTTFGRASDGSSAADRLGPCPSVRGDSRWWSMSSTESTSSGCSPRSRDDLRAIEWPTSTTGAGGCSAAISSARYAPASDMVCGWHGYEGLVEAGAGRARARARAGRSAQSARPGQYRCPMPMPWTSRNVGPSGVPDRCSPSPRRRAGTRVCGSLRPLARSFRDSGDREARQDRIGDRDLIRPCVLLGTDLAGCRRLDTLAARVAHPPWFTTLAHQSRSACRSEPMTDASRGVRPRRPVEITGRGSGAPSAGGAGGSRRTRGRPG